MATILFRTLIVYIFISAVFRMMGKREVGQMQISDLVAALLLSEVAALPLADHNTPLLNALVPVLIILALEILLTYFKNKSKILKRLLEGKPSFLIHRGKLNQGELERMRVSIEELLGECRQQGFSDLSDIEYAILEESGKLSLFPKAGKQPLTPDSLGIPAQETGIAHPLILDGSVNVPLLQRLGYDRAWLEKECARRGRTVSDFFLLTVDDAGNITAIGKEKKES